MRTELDQPMPDPTAAEIAAEERALQALEPAAALLPARIAALVRRTLDDAGAERGRVHPHRLRHWLVAVLFVVSLVSVGWIGARIVWPERRLAPLTMNYVEAIDVATNALYEESGHLHAIGRIDEECAYAAACLHRLAGGSDPELAAQAQRIRAAAAALLDGRADAPPEPVDGDLVDCVAVLDDPARPRADRAAALDRLGRRLQSGLTAILVARDEVLEHDASRAKVAVWVSRLAGDLRR